MADTETPQENSPDASEAQIEAALRWAHGDAMQRHRRVHGPVAVWLDGRVQTKRVFFQVPGDPFAFPPKKAS